MDDDDEMDYAEAAEATINNRKYLLNRLIKYQEVSKETSNDNKNEELSHRWKKKKIPRKPVVGTGPVCTLKCEP